MPVADVAFKIEELDIEAWDPSTMPDDCCSLLVGARHSGKSVLMTDIMWHKRKRLDMVVGMNPTEEANGTLSQFTPQCYIHHEFDESVIQTLIKRQRVGQALDKRARRRPDFDPRTYRSKTYKVGLILDDCMAEKCKDASGKKKKKVMKSEDIETVFKLGRHYKLFFMCAMQYIKDAPPDIRGNVDYVFVFDTNSASEKEKLWKEYFSMFATFSDFQKVFNACVGEEKYNCMVLDVRKSRGARGQGIYYYKATDRTSKSGGKAFTVGRSIHWRLSEYYYSDDAELDLDPSKLRGIDFDALSRPKKADAPSAAAAPAPLLRTKTELVVRRKTKEKDKDKDKERDKSSRHHDDRKHERASDDKSDRKRERYSDDRSDRKRVHDTSFGLSEKFRALARGD